MENHIELAINKCINHQIPFVAYQKESDNNIYFYSNPTPNFQQKNTDFFSIVEFNSSSKKQHRIYFEKNAIDTIEFIEKQLEPSLKCSIEHTPHLKSTDYNSYINRSTLLIDFLKANGGKVVLSKIYCGNHNISDYYKFMAKYFAALPQTFRYMYFTHQTGLWIGATPEILIKYDSNNQRLNTMSLAGTRRYSKINTDWDNKNIEEHNFVTNYIVEKLSSFNLNISVSPLESLRFGNNIEHLCSKIYAKDVPSYIIGDIMDVLNPTPALAGYPLEMAISKIELYEDHSRICYGGYIALNSNNNIDAYVNIRCAHFDQSSFCIYSGGGFTKDSNPYDEWDEAENKIKILKSIFYES